MIITDSVITNIDLILEGDDSCSTTQYQEILNTPKEIPITNDPIELTKYPIMITDYVTTNIDLILEGDDSCSTTQQQEILNTQ